MLSLDNRFFRQPDFHTIRQYNIFEELKYWGIFIGDFIKAILKINKLAVEVEAIGVLTENLSLVKKMREIRTLTLKSIVTNNSLYV